MSTLSPEPITENNLSHAWARAFVANLDRSDHQIAPLTLSVGGFQDGVPVEDLRIRAALDEALQHHNLQLCAESAATIFPYNIWSRLGRPPCAEIADRYLRLLPRLKARDRENQYGTYFERMIAYRGRGPGTETLNQLEFLIHDWTRPRERAKRPRQSALQVACFDPTKDHTGQSVRGFPCLQQLSFAYDDAEGLAVNAYYPTQYLFDRAYGNYLGLSHLGHFMAHELGLRLMRLNCFIGRPERGSVSKADLQPLKKRIRELLP
jgi:hypothetical protein